MVNNNASYVILQWMQSTLHSRCHFSPRTDILVVCYVWYMSNYHRRVFLLLSEATQSSQVQNGKRLTASLDTYYSPMLSSLSFYFLLARKMNVHFVVFHCFLQIMLHFLKGRQSQQVFHGFVNFNRLVVILHFNELSFCHYLFPPHYFTISLALKDFFSI